MSTTWGEPSRPLEPDPAHESLERAGWRGPLRRAVVTVGKDGLHRIGFVHRSALADLRPETVPFTIPLPTPAPPARRSRIPATAREVVARLATGASMLKRPAGWVSAGPPPGAEECRALRDRLGIGQREAAEGPVPHVSRSLVAELEHPTRTRHPMGSPTAERYVAWLRQQVAASSPGGEAKGGTSA